MRGTSGQNRGRVGETRRASHLAPQLGTQPLECKAGGDHLYPHARIDVTEAAEKGGEVPALLAQVDVVEVGVRRREQLGEQPDHFLRAAGARARAVTALFRVGDNDGRKRRRTPGDA